MTTKVCFKCKNEKELIEFYVHKKMADGHLNKCKECTKVDTQNRQNALRNNPDWCEKEKERNRNKYYRLEYKEKYKQSSEVKKITNLRHRERYPEKYKARLLAQRIDRKQGNHLHHWSYNKEHYCDVIELTINDHYFLHRHIIYDQERMMYRRIDTMELLDSKENHIEYFNIIKDKKSK